VQKVQMSLHNLKGQNIMGSMFSAEIILTVFVLLFRGSGNQTGEA
jgi:hypothetical protein